MLLPPSNNALFGLNSSWPPLMSGYHHLLESAWSSCICKFCVTRHGSRTVSEGPTWTGGDVSASCFMSYVAFHLFVYGIDIVVTPGVQRTWLLHQRPGSHPQSRLWFSRQKQCQLQKHFRATWGTTCVYIHMVNLQQQICFGWKFHYILYE